MSRGLGGAGAAALAAALVASSLAVSSSLLVATAGAGAGASVARAADTPPCSFDYCVGDQLPGPRPPVPGHPRAPRPRPGAKAGSGSKGGAPPAPVCVWVHWTQAESAFPIIPDPPSGEAELFLERCDGVVTGRVRWVQPGQAPPPNPMSPAQLADIVRVRLEGNLPAPRVSSSPDPGVAAIVGFPSFVAVDNWSGPVRDRQCDPAGGLCVAVEATPRLEWQPGEPGAPTVACAGAGTHFVSGGGSPDAQAGAPGACAYAYRSRTGVAGRPGEWPGQVTVVWELTWRSSRGGGGSLADVTKSAAVPRAVDEVQTVVESAG